MGVEGVLVFAIFVSIISFSVAWRVGYLQGKRHTLEKEREISKMQRGGGGWKATLVGALTCTEWQPL